MVIQSLKTYHLNALLEVPKIQTDLLWDLTFAFSALGLLYFFFIFYYKRRIRLKSELIAERKKDVAPMISTFLFHETEDSKEEKRNYVELKIAIRELLKDTRNKEVIAEVLLDLQKDVSGDARKRVYRLYKELELHLEAIKKLDSWRWEIVSKGILELTQMKVTSSYGFIKKFINDKRGIIRKQAQISAVTLTHEGINFFLDTTRYKISEWQQLKLLEVLQNLEGFSPPSFKVWLTSNNRDVVLFSLRLIKHYHQIDAGIAIVPLVKHKNDQVKAEAIFCLKEFRVKEAKETLKDIFSNCKTDIKIMILDFLAVLGEKKDLFFLENIEKRETNFIVKNKIHSVLNVIQPGTIVPTSEIDKNLDQRQERKAQIKPIPTNTLVMEEDNPLPPKESSDSFGKEQHNSLDNILDAENEDEEIFNLCFKEELEDILNELEEESEFTAILPLDFLPVVTENNEFLVEDKAPTIEEKDLDIDLGNTLNDEFQEVEFQLQLEDLLDGLKKEDIDDVDINNIDVVEASFLPLVTNDEIEHTAEQIDSDKISINEIVVFHEPVEYEEDYFEMYRELLKVEWMPVEESSLPSLDKPIDWNGITQSSAPVETQPTLTNNTETMTANVKPKPLNCLPEEEKTMNCFSIFAEMFRDSDKESKLILLDEILAIGEEKELEFLNIVKTDKEKSVRVKAEKIYTQLAKNLENKASEKRDVLSDEKQSGVEITSGNPIEKGGNNEVKNLGKLSLEEQEKALENYLDIEFDLSLETQEQKDGKQQELKESTEKKETQKEVEISDKAGFFNSIKKITLKIFNTIS